MGSDDYWKFLSSYAWRKTRARILLRDSGKCIICGDEAKEVHHHSYDPSIMSGQRDDLLVSLCSSCHHAIEFVPDGQRRSDLAEKRRVFDERCAAFVALRRKGVDVLYWETASRRTQEIWICFDGKYWGHHFVSMFGIVWELQTAFMKTYHLCTTRGRIDRFYDPKGFSLWERSSHRHAGTFFVRGDLGLVRTPLKRYPTPVVLWRKQLSPIEQTHGIRLHRDIRAAEIAKEWQQ